MSKHGLDQYQKAREERLGRNDARRIRGERDKACSSTSGASRRWPFELLQNAHDPGPRAPMSEVEVHLAILDGALVFRHNGRPFKYAELAALLSGGSSKEYGSIETSGRFGTGFLVTHALSPRIALRGLVTDGTSLEQFQIQLDRSGDDDAILANTKEAEKGIADARTIASSDGEWTAEFRYPLTDHRPADDGMEAVRSLALYLYGTCMHLGSLTLQSGVIGMQRWKPDATTEYTYQGVVVRERSVLFEATERVRYRVLRVASKDDSAALVLALRNAGERWEFQPPLPMVPRVFSRFPVRASVFLPINCVLDDSSLTVQEERDRVAMNDGDKRCIAAALRLIPTAMALGVEQRWVGLHQLGRLASVTTGFSESNDAGELKWWNEQLRGVADSVARMDLVATTKGALPAVTGDGDERHYADFVLARYGAATPKNQFETARVWALASKVSALDPPESALVDDWDAISAGWASLGVDVTRRGLLEIAGMLREHASKLGDLPVEGDPRAWLSEYLTTLLLLPEGLDLGKLIDGLLPNQTAVTDLCEAKDLKRDLGIPEALKEIAALLGHDIRRQLLDRQIAATATPLISKVVPNSLGEDELIKECITKLATMLPDGHKVRPQDKDAVRASIDLLAYLRDRGLKDAEALARRCPLLTRDDEIAHYTAKRIMAPAAAWPERARPFVDIYAPGRVLSDRYCETSNESSTLADALIQWGIAFAQPLIREARTEVSGALLRELVIGGDKVDDLIVRDEQFSQVALLSTELIQRCENDESRAALLLGFVLGYLAPCDSGWRESRVVTARRKGSPVTTQVRNALWVADLKSRAWVHVQGENGLEPVVPSPASLNLLLRRCAHWLVGNDAAIEFLIECFKFDVLSLRLEALPEDARVSVSEQLAALLRVGGGDAGFYQSVVNGAIAKLQRDADKERNRQFGLAIQEAIENLLRTHGLSVEVIDNGYDLEVEVPDHLSSIDAGTHEYAVGPYLLEVKATTTGDARLTPAQALTASTMDTFVLCVIDLRGVSSERLIEPWTVADVQPLARIVTGLRETVDRTRALIESATTQAVPVRNERQLRYNVSPAVWENGTSIAAWVESIAPVLKKGEMPAT